MTRHRALLRNHDFTVLWIGQTTSELGTRVSMFVFPLLAYALTGSVLLAALVDAVHLLGLAGALLPAGLLADQVDRRAMMRWASGGGVLLYASLAVAGCSDALTLPHLLVVALLTGVGAGVFAPAEMAAVRAVVATQDLPAALSQQQARQHVAALLGAPLGGALYGVGRWLPFAADALTFAISWVLLGRLRTDLRPPRASAAPSPRRDLSAGIRFIAASPFFRVLTGWAACANLVVNALFLVAVLRLVEAGVPALHIAVVEVAAGASGIAGALVAPYLIDRVPTGWLTVVVAWSFVPLLVPMMVWNDPLVVAAALAAGMFLNPAGNAGIGSYRVAMTPDDLQGRVQSASQLVSMSAMPLAPLLGGLLLAGLGGSAAIGVLAVLTAGVALIPTLARSVRSVPRPVAWAAAA